MYSLNDCARHCRLLLKKWRRNVNEEISLRIWLILLTVYPCVRNWSKKIGIFLLSMLLTIFFYQSNLMGSYDWVVTAISSSDKTSGITELHNDKVVTVLGKEETLLLRAVNSFVVTLPYTVSVTQTTTTTVVTSKITTTASSTTITTTTTSTSTIEEDICYVIKDDETETQEFDDSSEGNEEALTETETIEIESQSQTEENIGTSMFDVTEDEYRILCNAVGTEAGSDIEDMYEKAGVLVVIFNRLCYSGNTSIYDVIKNGGFSGSSTYLDPSYGYSDRVVPMVYEAVNSFLSDPYYYINSYYNQYGYSVDSIRPDGTGHNIYF